MDSILKDKGHAGPGKKDTKPKAEPKEKKDKKAEQILNKLSC